MFSDFICEVCPPEAKPGTMWWWTRNQLHTSLLVFFSASEFRCHAVPVIVHFIWWEVKLSKSLCCVRETASTHTLAVRTRLKVRKKAASNCRLSYQKVSEHILRASRSKGFFIPLPPCTLTGICSIARITTRKLPPYKSDADKYGNERFSKDRP